MRMRFIPERITDNLEQTLTKSLSFLNTGNPQYGPLKKQNDERRKSYENIQYKQGF